MKEILIAISGTILLTGSLVYGQPDTQVIDQRQMNQEDWIERSFDRGPLDRREAGRFDREQDRIDRMEHGAKAGGVMTRKEAAHIGSAQKRASRPVVREGHERRDARHR